MNNIPKIIHQIQEETQPLFSDFFSNLSQSWVENHPLWQYKLWSLHDIKELIHCEFPHFATFCDNNLNNKLLLEISRYFILYREGGIFVDSDIECIEPFDDIVKDKQCCFSYVPQLSSKKIISDSLIISKRESLFLKFIIERLDSNLNCLVEEGIFFLNKTYSLYDCKDEVEIISSSIINPCSPIEIELLLNGKISENSIDNIISEAHSICYYLKERAQSKRRMNSIDVLYLSSIVGQGGAFRAAHRIHLGLRAIGIDSKMLVLNSNLGEKGNLLDNIHVAIPSPQEKVGYHNDLEPLKQYPAYNMASHTFAPAMAGTDVNRYIDIFNPKIVQIHWINAGYIKIEDLGKIKKKIVWRLADCWPLTGGCYYYGDCKRYLTGCGKCPKLGSEDMDDLSHEIWKRKEKAWKEMDMVIVVPTLWMKQCVENSTLLKGREVFVIPNGLDLDKFYPVRKEIAREVLNIPSDKKVILYGATNAINDMRKGFSLLLQALQSLSDAYKNEYYLVIFGAERQRLDLDIPFRFMGYVRDHQILQALYSAADVMVVPSLEEAFGQTVTEAMACATPVVSFLETGPESIIEHKRTGYLARYADEKDLAAGIEWVLSSTKLNDELSVNARARIEESYDIRIIAKQYEKLYHQLLNS